MKTHLWRVLTASWGMASLWPAMGRAETKGVSESEAPVRMEAVSVSSVFVAVTLRPYVDSSGVAGPHVIRLMIEEVRPKSLAAQAGLAKGMQLVAIQGTLISGLHEAELEKLCAAPVIGDGLKLSVIDGPYVSGLVRKAREVVVPLARVVATTDGPKQFTITIDPNRAKAGDEKK